MAGWSLWELGGLRNRQPRRTPRSTFLGFPTTEQARIDQLQHRLHHRPWYRNEREWIDAYNATQSPWPWFERALQWARTCGAPKGYMIGVQLIGLVREDFPRVVMYVNQFNSLGYGIQRMGIESWSDFADVVYFTKK